MVNLDRIILISLDVRYSFFEIILSKPYFIHRVQWITVTALSPAANATINNYAAPSHSFNENS